MMQYMSYILRFETVRDRDDFLASLAANPALLANLTYELGLFFPDVVFSDLSEPALRRLRRVAGQRATWFGDVQFEHM